ncbi:MAG TPA: NAD-glutamate dehydrogenase domain-containing protein [Egibacteraceae bacterium]|nr:NAD-glutamate dehydrogenase domain-containing protein [Egibacteraceae bacterium]
MTDVDAAAGALGPLLSRVVERLEGDRAELVAALAQAAYRRTAAAEPWPADLDEVVAALDAGLDFIGARKPGTLALRVANPDAAARQPAGGTVIEVNVEDSPFLLSTVHEELAHRRLASVDVVHPIVGTERDRAGRVTAILPARDARVRESWIRIQLEDRLDPDAVDDLTHGLQTVLGDALAATRDHLAMRAQVDEAAFAIRASAGARYAAEEIDEAVALLDWLLDDHFVFLGARDYQLVETDTGRAAVVRPASGLGILADESASRYAEPVPLSELPPLLRARAEGGDLLIVSRTNRLSTVHRRERMIYVGVKMIDGEGGIEGEHRFLGLFAQKAFAEASSSLPVLRRKLRTILEWEDIVEHSFEERALRSMFEALPKHELFEADTADLHANLMELLDAQQRQDVRVLCRIDRRSASVLVVVPRDRFSARTRKRIQALLVDGFAADAVDYHLSITESDQALLHFVLHGDVSRAPVPLDALERRVLEVTRTWEDDLAAELERVHGADEGRRLAGVYAGVFPPGYTDTTPAEEAVADIAHLERLEGVRMALRTSTDDDMPLRFVLYKAGAGVELSTFLPILESLGLTVVEEVPHRLARGQEAEEVTLHDFGVRPEAGVTVHVDRDGPRLAAAARAMWEGRAETDTLNRLVLHAGLGWDQVAVLRAYRRYRRQAGTTFTDAYQASALVAHPEVAAALVGLFAAKFAPASAGQPLREEEARRRVLDGCDAVQRLDQDRILRGFLGMVDATVRTNYYRPDRAGLVLKIHSGKVPAMPKPTPLVEVLVYTPEMEGVHLRGGPVARGGIRWSERQEDVRTEVLGLMKAQMIKNALIVPTGSKGGFVLKRPPADPGEAKGEVHRLYRQYIAGLLDITDNIIAGEVVPPQGVRRHDGDDPYLVVAADRGTATFSDTANAVSAEYGFWLGDAFASGGSTGYDHKAMGITARGAWVAVQEHFRELDIDVQSEPITVVGIGDMSGDVFGNGMLQSRQTRLVAAFDHRHVFLDPEPDVAAAYRERSRLFRLAGSSWADYDRSLLSAGGGVWSRTVKAVPLSDEVRGVLRLDDATLSPPDLIRALLRAPVDLLFAGGIGTFVKSSQESDADVGDRVNDAIRVDAVTLGARVVGEGGNLSLTQRARIEYARRGGRCNTDAIDNAGGVATSDREVNLKILLRSAVEGGRLAAEERNALLEEMTDEVAGQVLRDVYLQTAAISREAAGSAQAITAYEHLMVQLHHPRGLEQATARLDRVVEALPSSEEMEERRRDDAGLTRPELSVLLGYAKIDLAERILDSALPDWPPVAPLLASYFPRPVRARFGDLIGQHRLRRELVATLMANEIVNRMGITYVNRTRDDLGCAASDVAAAYWTAREVCEADGHWRSIEALDGRVAPPLQRELAGEVAALVDAFTRRYLRPGEHRPLGDVIDGHRAAFTELSRSVPDLGSPGRRAARRGRIDRYIDLGVEEEVAAAVVGISDLTFVPDVAAVARDSGWPVTAVAEVFLTLAELLPLDALHARLTELDVEGHWERWQARGLTDELRDLRRDAAAMAVCGARADAPGDSIARFLDDRAEARTRLGHLVDRLQREPEAGLHGVAVAVRGLRELLA